MSVEDNIPNLTDKELENLHANAVRLVEAGSVQQRAQAETLLPLLGAALEERRAAKASALQDKRKIATQKRAQTTKAAKAKASAG